MITTIPSSTYYELNQPFAEQQDAALVGYLGLNRQDNLEEEKNDKLIILKNDIGDELFNSLSSEDRDFIINTAGSIDFGHLVDLDKVANAIKDYDPSEK